MTYSQIYLLLYCQIKQDVKRLSLFSYVGIKEAYIHLCHFQYWGYQQTIPTSFVACLVSLTCSMEINKFIRHQDGIMANRSLVN